MIKVVEIEVRNLLEGILQGDGDIRSRMASSSPYAGDPYPKPVQQFVNEAYQTCKNSPAMTSEQRESFIRKAIDSLKADSSVKFIH